MRSEKAREKRLAKYQRLKIHYADFMNNYPFTLDNLPNENWRETVLPDYEISTYGRIKSYKRGEQIIKPVLDPDGYLKVRLNNNNKRKNFSIHRLVAIAFIHNPDNKPEINHIDGDKFNNRVENLEWVTAAENIAHAEENNLRPHDCGEKCYQASTTNDIARYIRSEYFNDRKTQL